MYYVVCADSVTVVIVVCVLVSLVKISALAFIQNMHGLCCSVCSTWNCKQCLMIIVNYV